uniref:Receptor ligand binding region domain-containing protein n=1 Tax=Kalanchoe fedtschenkoi TaxID=63787 RepID=A0A7N0VJX4_KALFE
MVAAATSFFSICLILVFVGSSEASTTEVVNIGIVDDFNSRSGKEVQVAAEIALSHFYGYANSQPLLRFRNYGTSPLRAYSLAQALIKKNLVKALMGFQTWQAGAVTVDLSRKHRVPMLSLAEEVPSWATREWPFLINAARSQHAQAEAVVAIINSWNWRRVTIVYEDTGSSPDAIISHLINELQDAQVFIEELVSLSPWLAFSDEQYLQRQLESLKAKQSRVFIVHTSAVNLSSNIFIEAKKLGMMENDSVWITTTSITNQLYSLDETTISAMQGVLGVKSYFPTSGDRWNSFSSNFSVLFKSLYPSEPDREPGLYALQAYDAMWALALAVSNSSGQFLLDKISRCNFQGLNGEFKLSKGEGLEAQKVFAIVNVDGKSYRELGYWSDGLGFSLNLTEGSNYSKFMDILPPVRFWPGEAWPVPKGYTTPTDANPLIRGGWLGDERESSRNGCSGAAAHGGIWRSSKAKMREEDLLQLVTATY